MSDEENHDSMDVVTDVVQPQEAEAEASTSAAAASKPTFTVADVFGGDDDDSDLSSDEEDEKRPVAKQAVRRSLSPAVARDSSDSEDDDEEYTGGDYQPDYKQLGKKRSYNAVAEEDDEEEGDKYRSKGDDVAQAPKRKPKGERKKRVKKDSEAESRRRRAGSGDEEGDREQEVDEQTLRRRALDAKLDAIGKTGAKRRPKKRGDDGDDLMQDKQIEDITALMTSAIREDINLNNEKKPAIKKTLLLPKVMQVMQNASLQDSLLENSEFLSELTGFIEPLKDGSLPSLTIQRSILSQLNKFDVIDKDMLKASGLGKIVNFYTRTKRVQPEITRLANQLIDKWSKPILRAAGIASGSATGRMAATGHTEEESYGPGEGSGVITISAKQLREKEDLMQYALEAQREAVEERKGSRRPNVIGHSYTKAPPSRRIARSNAEQEREDARLRQLELQAAFRKKSMLGASR